MRAMGNAVASGAVMNFDPLEGFSISAWKYEACGNISSTSDTEIGGC
jgi:hypothetical protein